MRILHVSEPTSEGTAHVIANLVAAGAGDGDEVVVACPSAGPLREWVERSGGGWRPLEISRRTPWGWRRAVDDLSTLFDAFDVIVLHSSLAGALGRIAARRAQTYGRTIFVPHGWSWYSGGATLQTLYRVFERWASPRGYAIVVVGPSELSEGRRVLGGKAPLRLIPNGISCDEGTGQSPGRQPGTVLCLGRLTRQKGQDLLISAVATGRIVGSVQLAGDGPAEGDLKRQAAELGVSDSIEFLGFRSDPIALFRRAEVVVVPSRWEGLSVALLEAMASRCAIVATGAGASGILSAETAIVIDDGESDAETALNLAEAVGRLQASPELRERLGAAAQAHVRAEHSLEVSLARHRSLWREVEAQAGPRARRTGEAAGTLRGEDAV